MEKIGKLLVNGGKVRYIPFVNSPVFISLQLCLIRNLPNMYVRKIRNRLDKMAAA